jgi:HPt (histidine-containing phosphotransfer) domain-containing protein
MRSAVATCDATEVRRAAHTLKSNAATFGIVELTPLCRELEERASGGDLADAAVRVAAIDRALADARPELEELLRG